MLCRSRRRAMTDMDCRRFGRPPASQRAALMLVRLAEMSRDRSIYRFTRDAMEPAFQHWER